MIDTENFPFYGKKDDLCFVFFNGEGMVTTNYDVLSPLEEIAPGVYEQRIKMRLADRYSVVLMQQSSGGRISVNSGETFTVNKD